MEEILKQFKEKEIELSDYRDRLRSLFNDTEDMLDSVTRAHEALETAIDALSEYV